MKLKYYKGRNVVFEEGGQVGVEERVSRHIMPGILLFRNYHLERLYTLELWDRLLSCSYLIFLAAMIREALHFLNFGILMSE